MRKETQAKAAAATTSTATQYQSAGLRVTYWSTFWLSPAGVTCASAIIGVSSNTTQAGIICEVFIAPES